MSMRTEEFPPGKLVFAEGSSGREAYRILSGRVEISIQEEGRTLVLATLGENEIFGEMAMVENRPRSASARVLEATSVEVIEREDFQEILSSGEELVVPYLMTIFDRLRITNDRLLVALNQLDELTPTSTKRRREVFTSDDYSIRVSVKPASEEMRRQTALQGCVVRNYPFHFGRRGELAGSESTTSNQLLVADRSPYCVSRKHCVLGSNADGVFIEDHTSKLGTVVNGIEIGANSRETRVRLSVGENTLVLGGADSQVSFILTVTPPQSA